MESFLILYALFAVTTAVTACIVLLAPVINFLRDKDPLNPLVQSTAMGYFVFFIMAALFAPIMLIPIIFPAANEQFKDKFIEVIQE